MICAASIYCVFIVNILTGNFSLCQETIEELKAMPMEALKSEADSSLFTSFMPPFNFEKFCFFLWKMELMIQTTTQNSHER